MRRLFSDSPAAFDLLVITGAWKSNNGDARCPADD
jgi:hypothetical protein